MDSSGNVRVFDLDINGLEPRLRDSGFIGSQPIPEDCNARKVLAALDKLLDAPAPIQRSHAALLPLTPFEQGYVIGIHAEYQAWRRREGR